MSNPLNLINRLRLTCLLLQNRSNARFVCRRLVTYFEVFGTNGSLVKETCVETNNRQWFQYKYEYKYDMTHLTLLANAVENIRVNIPCKY